MEWLLLIGIFWLISLFSGSRNDNKTQDKHSGGQKTEKDRREDALAQAQLLAEMREQLKSRPALPEAQVRLPVKPYLSSRKVIEIPVIKVNSGISERRPITERANQIHVSTSADKVAEMASSYGPENDSLTAYEGYKNATDSLASSSENNAYQKARDKLAGHGVNSFWHMTHWQNLKGILHQGILNHDLARLSTTIVDISERTVQERRATREPRYDRLIHDYAPLYINPRNPMLFLRKDIAVDLCLVEVSVEVLRDTFTGKLLFTDGNAASAGTTFYTDLADLDKLSWDVLNSEYWHEFVDGKRKRCAEVLVHQHISQKFIKGVHVSTRARADLLQASNQQWSIQFSPQLFFR